jgi:Ca2+-binding EF-hand superfamily protein
MIKFIKSLFSKKKEIITFSCKDWAIRKYSPVELGEQKLPQEYLDLPVGKICPFERTNQSYQLSARQCPSINSFLKSGYVISAWCDIEISYFLQTKMQRTMQNNLAQMTPRSRAAAQAANAKSQQPEKSSAFKLDLRSLSADGDDAPLRRPPSQQWQPPEGPVVAAGASRGGQQSEGPTAPLPPAPGGWRGSVTYRMTLGDLQAELRLKGLHFTDRECACMFAALDVDADGVVGLAEFAAAVLPRLDALAADTLAGVYARLDADGDGRVSLADLLVSGRWRAGALRRGCACVRVRLSAAVGRSPCARACCRPSVLALGACVLALVAPATVARNERACMTAPAPPYPSPLLCTRARACVQVATGGSAPLAAAALHEADLDEDGTVSFNDFLCVMCGGERHNL